MRWNRSRYSILFHLVFLFHSQICFHRIWPDCYFHHKSSPSVICVSLWGIRNWQEIETKVRAIWFFMSGWVLPFSIFRSLINIATSAQRSDSFLILLRLTFHNRWKINQWNTANNTLISRPRNGSDLICFGVCILKHTQLTEDDTFRADWLLWWVVSTLRLGWNLM